MGHGYAVLGPFMGEIIEERSGDVSVLEFRPDIKRYTIENPRRISLRAHDQFSLWEIAAYFEEFGTSGEPLPPDSGFYVNRRVAVLHVALEPGMVRVTVRPLPLGDL